MRRGKVVTKVKKTIAVLLTAAMVVGIMPLQQTTQVKAADNSPYVVSTGRMVYASSSVSNSDPAYTVDGSKSTRWESAWGNNNEWIYVDLGKVTQITGVKLYWEESYMLSSIKYSSQMMKNNGTMFIQIQMQMAEMMN